MIAVGVESVTSVLSVYEVLSGWTVQSASIVQSVSPEEREKCQYGGQSVPYPLATVWTERGVGLGFVLHVPG